jgi:hypothetical protein
MAYEALGANLDAPLRPDLRLQKINEYLKGKGLIQSNDSISASSLKRYLQARRDAMDTSRVPATVSKRPPCKEADLPRHIKK